MPTDHEQARRWLQADQWVVSGKTQSWTPADGGRDLIYTNSVLPGFLARTFFEERSDGTIFATWQAPEVFDYFQPNPKYNPTGPDRRDVNLYVQVNPSGAAVIRGYIGTADIVDSSYGVLPLPPTPGKVGATAGSKEENYVNTWAARPVIKQKITTIEFWLNVFIASNEADAIPVPKGQHAGKTMVPGLPLIGDCFLTDQSEFSPDPGASSRIQLHGKFDTLTGKLETEARAGLTVELDCEDGDVEGTGTANLGGVDWSETQLERDEYGWIKGARVNVAAAVSDPLVFLAQVAGAVDLSGLLIIETTDRWRTAKIGYSGLIDKYPHYEMYARADGGVARKVFQKAPGPRATALSLVGRGNVRLAGQVELTAGK